VEGRRNISQHLENNALELWNSDDELYFMSRNRVAFFLDKCTHRTFLHVVDDGYSNPQNRGSFGPELLSTSGYTDSPGADVRG
jgi:hypothetical protein